MAKHLNKHHITLSLKNKIFFKFNSLYAIKVMYFVYIYIIIFHHKIIIGSLDKGVEYNIII